MPDLQYALAREPIVDAATLPPSEDAPPTLKNLRSPAARAARRRSTDERPGGAPAPNDRALVADPPSLRPREPSTRTVVGAAAPAGTAQPAPLELDDPLAPRATLVNLSAGDRSAAGERPPEE